MNAFQSLRLIHQIYFKKGLPDLDLIQSYGLLAVKIGQLHALRLDFLPAEKCHHLSRLYRKARPASGQSIKDLITDHRDLEFLSNFQYIDSKPLAVASVGQVHKATTKKNQKVVIKVVKKDFRDRFSRDVKKLKKFLLLTLSIYPKLKKVGDPVGILQDIEEYTTAELDLRNEKLGIEELKNIYIENKNKFDLSMLGFNNIFKELSNENILVSEFINSPTIDELLEEGKFEYKSMLDFFYLQGFYIFIAGTFHGDSHPGNILYDGEKFYFLDTAYIGRVGDNIRKNLFLFFEALSIYNYSDCANYLNKMSEIQLVGNKYNEFEREFKKLYKDYRGKNVSQVSLTKQMMLTIKLGVIKGMVFEKGIFSIIRTLMYLDGMVLKCNPRAILMEDMRMFIDKYKKHI